MSRKPNRTLGDFIALVQKHFEFLGGSSQIRDVDDGTLSLTAQVERRRREVEAEAQAEEEARQARAEKALKDAKNTRRHCESEIRAALAWYFQQMVFIGLDAVPDGDTARTLAEERFTAFQREYEDKLLAPLVKPTTTSLPALLRPATPVGDGPIVVTASCRLDSPRPCRSLSVQHLTELESRPQTPESSPETVPKTTSAPR